MSSASELDELFGFLRSPQPAVRKGAVEAVLGLTASHDGRELLKTTKAAAQLRRLVGDLSVISEPAIKAMINLSADAAMLEQLLKEGMVSSLMESLRDDDCSPKHKRLIIMLLTNLSQTGEGCSQILQRTEAGGAMLGLHYRRLIQWFVAPMSSVAAAQAARMAANAAAAAASSSSSEDNELDTFEHVASILVNVTQEKEGRLIILEPERGILGALLPNLRSPSIIRRRGVAMALRNCLIEEDPKGEYLRSLLSPSVDIATHLLYPLACPNGAAEYKEEERVGMHDSLAKTGSSKRCERDPATRRALVESLLLLCATRAGRDHLRQCRAYIVVRAFHRWLEDDDRRAVEESSTELCADDEAAVSSIDKLVNQLFRDDEVKHTGQVTGVMGATTGSTTASSDASASASASAAPAASPAPSAGGGAGPQIRLRPGVQVVSEEEARAKAVAVSKGHEVDDNELEELVTAVPDWTEDDPELPPAFQEAFDRHKQQLQQQQQRQQEAKAEQQREEQLKEQQLQLLLGETGDDDAEDRPKLPRPTAAASSATASSAATAAPASSAASAAPAPASAATTPAPSSGTSSSSNAALAAVESAGLGELD